MIDNLLAKAALRGTMPAWRLGQDETGAYHSGPNHPDPEVGMALTMQALGSLSPELIESVIQGLANLCKENGVLSETRLNRLIATVRAIGPKDELEILMATQMAAIHDASMTSARQLATADSIEQRESAERAFNKLTRTFATQVEALKRHRTKGEQRVVVEHQHIHVYPGGQAVVGTFTQEPGGGGTNEIGDQSHERDLRLPQRPAMLGTIEADEASVPSSCDDR